MPFQAHIQKIETFPFFAQYLIHNILRIVLKTFIDEGFEDLGSGFGDVRLPGDESWLI